MTRKTGKAPLPRDPMFVRLHGKAVHVVDNPTTAGYQRDVVGDPALDPFLAEPVTTHPLSDGPTDPIAWTLGVVRTRCGREIVRNRGGLGVSGDFTGVFDDADLCSACYRTVAPEDQHRLFGHDQPAEVHEPEAVQ